MDVFIQCHARRMKVRGGGAGGEIGIEERNRIRKRGDKIRISIGSKG